jgi:hypothetical protein
MYLGKQTVRIEIGDKYVLRGVEGIDIKKSVLQFIDTAKVKLPLSVVMRNNDMLERIKITDKIKEGDKITIAFGYSGKNNVEFEGYIRRINFTQPLELECEDELYLLRKVFFKKSFKRVSLKELLQFVLDGLEDASGLRLNLYEKLPEMFFSNFTMREASGISVLQELKDKYGIVTFLTVVNGEKTLYAGLAYGLQKEVVKHVIDRNVISASSLKYERAEDDKKYKVKVTVFKRNGTSESFDFGDKDGELRTLHRVGEYTKAELEQFANAEMEKLKREGYKGSYETFLFPNCEPGMRADIENRQFPERKGRYYVSSVTTTFNTSGGRRKIEAGLKLST